MKNTIFKNENMLFRIVNQFIFFMIQKKVFFFTKKNHQLFMAGGWAMQSNKYFC